jgi:ABC-type branched-subunit amino acid transport system ATPase component
LTQSKAHDPLDGITKSFGALAAIDNLSLTIERASSSRC